MHLCTFEITYLQSLSTNMAIICNDDSEEDDNDHDHTQKHHSAIMVVEKIYAHCCQTLSEYSMIGGDG